MSSLVILVLMIVSGTSSTLSPPKREIEVVMSSGASSSELNFDVSRFRPNTHDVTGRTNSDIEENAIKNDEKRIFHVPSSKNNDQTVMNNLEQDREVFRNYQFVPKIVRKRRTIADDEKISRNYDYPEFQTKLSNGKRYRRDSPIYYIKLPPTPYSYVPGYGYISRPPIPMIPGLRRPAINHGHRPSRPQTNHQRLTTETPVIRVPIRFVNNGKLGGVYQLTENSLESTLNRLDHGPYFFSGRPTSIYVLNHNGRKTEHRPMRLAYQSNVALY